MRNAHDRAVRDALWQLATPRTSAPDAPLVTLPLLLRAPSIAALWGATLLAVVAALALGRVQVPRRTQGAAIAVHADSDSLALLLLLPAATRPYVRLGQQATLDTGDREPLVVTVTGIEPALLDARAARTRFAAPASLIAQLDTPKLVARLSHCGQTRCLTPAPGTTYAATASLGTRSLVSYAMSGL